ncbi:hypothetical protein [Pedobacter cryotolerans]|uniref:Uncharacterized protein n=1 Tax=Pedobacter cryotolerans TaxID=2571270 RepID=A0A4U1BZB7_9SPHI|nr:hypothetical protein [Pedobacter cryotolerans]TKB98152.1 hypothetical protein FA045_14295 [Pedobacter cryotolerans]
MKRVLLIMILSISGSLVSKAQTAIEKQTSSSASSVLEFANGTTKGIILPSVETLPTTPANGTFLLDKTDKKIKIYQNGYWLELSGVGNTTTIVPYSGTVDNGKKTIIGDKTTTADGILVLEATNKALVLPHVANPHLNVKTPYPGMLCYDTVSKSLAVFDGSVWNYWK